MRKHPIDCPVTGQALVSRPICGAQNNQACAQFCGGRQYLDGWVAVYNTRFHPGATGFGRTDLGGKNSQFLHRD